MLIKKFNQPFKQKIVLALGFFDCMHLGHLALLKECQKIAKQTNSLSAIFTFDNNHLAVLGKQTKLIYTFEERLAIFQNVNVDLVVTAHFDRQFMALTAQQFLDILLDCYDIQAVVCGFDYTCGSDIKGCEYIRQYLSAHNINLSVVDKVTFDNQKVSSTLVRSLLINNDIATANTLLSQPYSVTGTVVSGRQIGRSLGFPTANISIDKDKLLPSGVFGGYVNINDTQYKAIINIGNAPTFDFATKLIEVHIIDFDGNLYGKQLTIYLTKYLRDIVKFSTYEQLVDQLHKDVESVKND